MSEKEYDFYDSDIEDYMVNGFQKEPTVELIFKIGTEAILLNKEDLEYMLSKIT